MYIHCDPSFEPSRDGSNEGPQRMFLLKNIYCEPSFEPSHRDGSNEGSQYMFLLRNKKNYL